MSTPTSKEFAERFNALWCDIAAHKPGTWQNVYAIVVAFQALWVDVIEALTHAEERAHAAERGEQEAHKAEVAARVKWDHTEARLQACRITLDCVRTENAGLLADLCESEEARKKAVGIATAADRCAQSCLDCMRTYEAERDAWRRLHDAALESEDELRVENRKLRDTIRAMMTRANPPNAFRRSGLIPVRDWTAPTIRDAQRVYRSGEVLKTPGEIEAALRQGHELDWYDKSGHCISYRYDSCGRLEHKYFSRWEKANEGLHYVCNGNEKFTVCVA